MLKIKKKPKIVLFGAGGHAASCIQILETLKTYKIIFLIDKKIKNNFNFYQVKKEQSDYRLYKKYANNALIAIGHTKDNKIRKIIFNRLKENKFIIPKVISKHSTVAKNSQIGEGTIVMDGVRINSGVKIGKNCIINTNSIIEHGTEIGDNCHIAPGAILNGDIKIHSDTFVGSGSIIKEKVTIPQNTFIKMGSVIKRNPQ